tara:strand:- start:98 stop:211 length:114 start_codon:yes stop_codon:yes gene_type:complete
MQFHFWWSSRKGKRTKKKILWQREKEEENDAKVSWRV